MGSLRFAVPAGRGAVSACVALLVGVTCLRFVVDDPIEAVGFLYVVPISLAAVEFGWRGGVAAAGGALVLTGVWAELQHVPLGLVGYGVRTSMFAGLGVLVGLQSEERRQLLRERDTLVSELQATAMRDQLTGLANRRAWDERFADELGRARRSGARLSVAVIDLDGFKAVNDTFGHAEGDRLLKRHAAAWSSAVRETDFIARLGGDEFLVLFPECGAEEAAAVAQRMVEATRSAAGVSIGIAELERDDGDQLVGRADRAMYESKAMGGGCVVIAQRSRRQPLTPWPL